VAQYVPADERHIGYLSTSTPKPKTIASGFLRVAGPAADDDKLSVPAIVPFEKFEALNEKKRIIVLWLDEEALAHRQNPIASLAGLLCKLDLEGHNNESFVFLGPQDSDVLQIAENGAGGRNLKAARNL
jgi:hypothetical protein